MDSRSAISSYRSRATLGLLVLGLALLASACVWIAPIPRPSRPAPPPCIPSGDQTAIQDALTGYMAKAVLCPNAVFELSESIFFTHHDQQIYTEGYPTDDSRALLRIADSSVATAVFAGNYSRVRLSHVIVDGNRPQLGVAMGGLLEWGGVATGQAVEWVKAYEPRGWSVLVLGHGDGLMCSGAVARHNELGPGGRAEYGMADGISLACRNSIVTDNTIVDVTDGGIVIFQAPGSLVANNTITATERVMFYGISMEDYGPYDGDFTGTRVTGNTIDAAGALIRRGIAMGPHVGCIPPQEMTLRSRGAAVTDNVLMGTHMGYGFVVSGVEDWTATGNTDLSTHLVPQAPQDCFGQTAAAPAGFQRRLGVTSGTFQSEFQDAVLGFTTYWWPVEAVASEPCLENLIGAAVLDEIRAGARGEVLLALESAPNGERIGQCISIYQPPDISALSGKVVVEVLPCSPYCIELRLVNIDDTHTVDLTGAQFLLEMFLVDCPGLPASLAPWEEARCTINDFVVDGLQALKWYGFPAAGNIWVFTYPF